MSSTTTETLKLFDHLGGIDILVLILGSLVGLFIFLGGIQEMFDFGSSGCILILFSVGIFSVVIMGIINCFSPINVTKTTQVQKRHPQVIKVEGKLLSTDGLTLFLKERPNHYMKKKLTIDRHVKIKEGTSYSYTEVKTKISYETKQKFRATFETLPKNQFKTEIILTVPKEELE